MNSRADVLFSINSLPDDEAYLKDLQTAVNARLGNKAVNLHDELVENMEVARALRNKLCGYTPATAQNSGGSFGSLSDSGFGDDGDDYSDTKDSSKVASVRAFTDIIEKLVRMQEIVLSQQGIAALQGAIVDVLLEVDPDIQRQVMVKFRERLTELEGQRR